VNPYEVISWNTENRFLDKLSARGVNVVPSAFVPESQPAIAVLAAIERQNWTEALVLPAILPEEAMHVYIASGLNQSSGTQIASPTGSGAAAARQLRPVVL